jgi:hypothetical protein
MRPSFASRLPTFRHDESHASEATLIVHTQTVCATIVEDAILFEGIQQQ